MALLDFRFLASSSAMVVCVVALSGACSSSSSNNDANTDGGSTNPNGGDGASQSSSKDGAPSTPATPVPVGGHSTAQTISVATASGVQARTYDITVPATCDSAHPVPVVFIFHGDGGKGSDMYGSGFAIETAASTAGGSAIFVYPNGLDNNVDDSGSARAWNLYTDPGTYPYTATNPSGNNDVDFFDSLLAFLETSSCADSNRVFITGMSNGGYMASQLARWRAKVIKGTAPQSGAAPFGNNATSGTGANSDWQPPQYCVGTTGAVPALIIHGDADSTVDISNGFTDAAYWDTANACANTAGNCNNGALSDPPSTQTTATTPSPCVASNGCPSASPVVFCKIPGMGHTIWSNAPTTIWNFFASL